jgi:hypothetical protein
LAFKLERNWHLPDIANLDQVRSFIQSSKPEWLSDSEFADLKSKYVNSDKQYVFDSKTALERLLKPKPAEIPEEYWFQRVEYLQKLYFEHLSRDMNLHQSPLQFLNEQNLAPLGQKDRDSLRELAFKLERNLHLPDIADLDQVRSFIQSSKPEWLSDSEFADLKSEFEKLTEAESITREYELELGKLIEEREKVKVAKEKIEQQLCIINDLLSDPSTLEPV